MKAFTARGVSELEQKLGCSLPPSLRAWLVLLGHGDIDGQLSFRKAWFNVIDCGQLKGHVPFAMDVLGGLFTFSPETGAIHYASRSAPEYAKIAPDFRTFMEELVRRDYKLDKWVASLPLVHDDRNA